MTQGKPPERITDPSLLVSVGYVALVFVGAALVGLVVLPALTVGIGVFETRSDAEAYFSWATLKGVPYLLGLSILSLLAYPWISAQRFALRIALTLTNVAVVWAAAAATSLLRLG